MAENGLYWCQKSKLRRSLRKNYCKFNFSYPFWQSDGPKPKTMPYIDLKCEFKGPAISTAFDGIWKQDIRNRKCIDNTILLTVKHITKWVVTIKIKKIKTNNYLEIPMSYSNKCQQLLKIINNRFHLIQICDQKYEQRLQSKKSHAN